MQPQFALWWRMTEACSGLRGSLADVRWYVQPGLETLQIPGDAGRYGGYWWADGNRVLLTERAVTDGWLVRHEMLHALVGRAGHPREQFGDRCGGIVTCTGECQRDAGGAATFGFVEGPTVWSYAWTSESRVGFGPGQTKRYTYDRATRATAGHVYRAGAHTVRGFFNSDTTPPLAFTIAP
jgi:hypothetical protein